MSSKYIVQNFQILYFTTEHIKYEFQDILTRWQLFPSKNTCNLCPLSILCDHFEIISKSFKNLAKSPYHVLHISLLQNNLEVQEYIRDASKTQMCRFITRKSSKFGPGNIIPSIQDQVCTERISEKEKNKKCYQEKRNTNRIKIIHPHEIK